MKKFKKALLLTSAIVVVALSAVGCKKTTKCEGICGEEKKCSKVEVAGEKVWLCEDCEAFVKAAESFMK